MNLKACIDIFKKKESEEDTKELVDVLVF